MFKTRIAILLKVAMPLNAFLVEDDPVIRGSLRIMVLNYCARLPAAQDVS